MWSVLNWHGVRRGSPGLSIQLQLYFWNAVPITFSESRRRRLWLMQCCYEIQTERERYNNTPDLNSGVEKIFAISHRKTTPRHWSVANSCCCWAHLSLCYNTAGSNRLALLPVLTLAVCIYWSHRSRSWQCRWFGTGPIYGRLRASPIIAISVWRSLLSLILGCQCLLDLFLSQGRIGYAWCSTLAKASRQEADLGSGDQQ